MAGREDAAERPKTLNSCDGDIQVPLWSASAASEPVKLVSRAPTSARPLGTPVPQWSPLSSTYVSPASSGACACIAWRYVIVALSCIATVIAYSDRSNLAVAIVAISRHRGWSPATSGAMLGAFFYGYITTQIAGGYLSHRLGGTKVLAAGMAICSATTLLHYPAALAGGAPLFFAARIVVGISEGVVFPSIHALLADWVSAGESGKAVALIGSAAYAGTILASAVSPPLLERFGWPAVFYFFGALGLAWLPFWLFFASDRPEEHRFISAGEVEHVSRHRHSSRPATPVVQPARTSPAGDTLALAPAHVSPDPSPPASTPASPRETAQLTPPPGAMPSRGPTPAVPWSALLSRREVWAIVVANFCGGWGFFVILSWLPEYFFAAFGTRIADLPVFVAAPYVAQALVSFAAGAGADALVARGWPVLRVRHIFQTTAMLGAALFLLLAAFAARSAAQGAAFVTAGLGFSALATGGSGVNHLDITPAHAGVTFGIANTAAVVAGIVAVPLTGVLLNAGASWGVVFALGAGFYALGAAVWLLLAGADVLDLGLEPPPPPLAPRRTPRADVEAGPVGGGGLQLHA